jgi:hypothetical protein
LVRNIPRSGRGAVGIIDYAGKHYAASFGGAQHQLEGSIQDDLKGLSDSIFAPVSAGGLADQ